MNKEQTNKPLTINYEQMEDGKWMMEQDKS